MRQGFIISKCSLLCHLSKQKSEFSRVIKPFHNSVKNNPKEIRSVPQHVETKPSRPNKLSNIMLLKVRYSPGFKLFDLCNKCLFSRSISEERVEHMVELAKDIQHPVSRQMHIYSTVVRLSSAYFSLKAERILDFPDV